MMLHSTSRLGCQRADLFELRVEFGQGCLKILCPLTFLFEDLSLETWERGLGKPLKKILEHPYDQMFRQREFVDELRKLGFATETYEQAPVGFYYFWGKATKSD